MIGLDFETGAIVRGSGTPPEPVGVAITFEGGEGHYFSWGHPEGNNCTKEVAAEVLKKVWDSGEQICTHNGPGFDVRVAQHWFGLPEIDPLRVEDTQFLAYLNNPHQRSLKLKDLAHDLLGIPPDDQADLHAWIMANTECRTPSTAGAYISQAPASLVAPYAVSDNTMSRGLFEFYAGTREHQLEAYQREQRLAPVLARMKERGIRVDIGRLRTDYTKALSTKAELENLIREHLKVGPEFNPGSDKELGALLLARGYEGFLTTPTGKVSMARPSLESALSADPKLMSMLKSRSIYDTLCGTFMSGWLAFADQNGGRIHASYNQTRNAEGFGTRTGRLSSSDPNAQNIPKDLGLDYFGNHFPDMRSYLLPEVGHVWICGDIKNQEPRLTAHYEGGAFLEAFLKDPAMDPYTFVMKVCGMDDRQEAKKILLGLIYAMGIATMADQIGCTAARATMLRNMVKAALPDVMELDRDCKRRFNSGLPIKTLGGRVYYCEPPSNGRQWGYKALNTLIQGSAADQTKEALIYVEPKFVGVNGHLLSTVHDEISGSAEERHFEYLVEQLNESVNALACDTPMMMDVGYGGCWGEAKV